MPQIESFKKTLRDIYYQYIIILWAVELAGVQTLINFRQACTFTDMY
jgi:hypothetical protein